jgi:hypothetical protein
MQAFVCQIMNMVAYGQKSIRIYAIHTNSTAIAVMMMEAVSTSETSVSFYQTTRRNILEGSYLRSLDLAYTVYCAVCLYVCLLNDALINYRGCMT